MSVYDNMAFGLELAKASKGAIDERVREAAKLLRIDTLLDRKPRELSGGQRQRVAIGRAIVRDPKVFLFDEPLSNLDAALRVNTRIELTKLHADSGATMIYVTHDQVEAMTLADRIVVLNAGRVEQVGTPLDLYHRPANLFVAGFIGSPQMNLLKGEVVGAGTDTRVRLAEGITIPVAAAPLRLNQQVTLGIRPDHVTLADDGLLTGTVALVEELGENHLLYVDLDALPGTRLTMRGFGDARRGVGDRVAAELSALDCHVFDAAGAAVGRGASPASRAATGRVTQAAP
jgi:multiple sugar transport system ATP-binding protein